MFPTEPVWQKHPPTFQHYSVVEKRRRRRGHMRLQLTECAFEPDNPEGGDRGEVIAPSGARIQVIRVIRNGLTPWIELASDSEEWEEGQLVEQVVNRDRRAFHAAHHSLGHAVTAAVKKITGKAYIGKGTLYDWGSELVLFYGCSLDESDVIEKMLCLVSDEIKANHIVQVEQTSRLEMLERCGTEFDAVIPVRISTCRIVTFSGSPLASIPCAGVHVEMLGQIGTPRIRTIHRADGNLVFEFELLQKGSVIRRS